jgi:hypothetical protein
VTAEIQPICPSCRARLEKVPQRKTKCKACGDFIYNKYTPDDPTRRLMNQAQADAAEAAWAWHSARAAVLQIANAHGIEEAKAVAALHAADGDLKRATRSLFHRSAMLGDRDAVLQMMSSSEGEDRERWQMLLIEMNLAKLASQGIRSAQLSSGGAKDRLCPVCRALDQTIISVHAGARAVIPENCTCRVRGLLSTSGWIKRPDGTGYVDFGSPHG